jgi:alpha-L-rhamnosidase
MNSYNHYAYGAVADWVFEQAAGIRHGEDAPGFSSLIYAPKPDLRIGWLTAELNTRHGLIKASWFYEGERVRYELETPVDVKVCISGWTKNLPKGTYTFWG